MCIGIPMQLISCDTTKAICNADGQHQQVDISLVGEQPEGTWLLVFLGAAREVLTPEAAAKTKQAITAIEAVMAGQEADMDALFADLFAQTPQLPPHLQAQADAALERQHTPTTKNNDE